MDKYKEREREREREIYKCRYSRGGSNKRFRPGRDCVGRLRPPCVVGFGAMAGTGSRGTFRAPGGHHQTHTQTRHVRQTNITEYIHSQSQRGQTAQGGSSGSGLSLGQRVDQFMEQGIPIPAWIRTAAHSMDARNIRRDADGEGRREFRPRRGKRTRPRCLWASHFRGQTAHCSAKTMS